MSERYWNMVKCPHCGKANKFEMWRNINVSDNPELKERVKTKDVFKMTCKKCGSLVNADHQFMYEDPENNIIIQYATEKDVPEVKKALTEIKGKIRRIVSWQNDLIEKIMIFDAGLDDRIIEIIKAIYVNQLYKINPSYQIDEILYDNSKDDAKIVFVGNGGIITESAVSDEVYASIEGRFKDKLVPIEDGEDMTVDFEWAIGFLEEHKPEGEQ